MEPDDLLCSRNARPQKGGWAAWPSSCSRNAHDKNVLAWDKSASRRARGRAGENGARNRRSISPPPLERERARLEGSFIWTKDRVYTPSLTISNYSLLSAPL